MSSSSSNEKSKSLFSRNRRRLFALVSLCLIAYCCAYLWLRHNHYFIHRAGYYADPPTTHFIEPGEVADGPEIFGAVVFALAGSGKEPTPQEFEAALSQASKQVVVEGRFRRRLLWLFKPLTLAEESIWKLVDPNPRVP
jgi:hypothetical protein